MLVKADYQAARVRLDPMPRDIYFAITIPGSGETGKRPLDQSAPDASERKESHVNCQVPDKTDYRQYSDQGVMIEACVIEPN